MAKINLPSHPFPVGGEIISLSEAVDLGLVCSDKSVLEASLRLAKEFQGGLFVQCPKGTLQAMRDPLYDWHMFRLTADDDGWA